jgi:transposase
MGRIEILTGVERRREWSDEDKLRILAEAEEDGVSLASVARRHDLLPQQLYTWRRLFRQAAEAQATGAPPSMTLVPLEVVASGVEDERVRSRPSPRRRRVCPIEVTLANGRRLRADPTIAAEDLRRLIQVLDEA